MVSTLLPLFFAFVPQSAEPRALASRISEVTVYGGTASVRRSATVPAGDGLYVIGGLPMTLDPESLRVRLAGGEVVGVETRRRVLAAASDERLADLRARIRALEDELQVLKDEDEVQGLLAEHVTRLLRQEESTHKDEVAAGRVNPEAWEANYRFLAQKMKELKDARRALARKKQEKELALADLRAEQGRAAPGAGVPQLDVVLDLVGGGGVLELEYLVANAGWEPYYDLRAKKDLAGVELAYRARIFQQTGEDWSEAEVLLSTAQPQRGAQGPEPVPQWLSLNDRRRPAPEEERDMRALGYGGGDAPEMASNAPASPARKAVYAAVESEGLSVRYRLPRKETIASRPEPTSVLIGRAELVLTSEHYVVPALDTTVWLRGKAKNSSPWVLLPGRAAVYFGADFVGHAELASVQVAQEFELALGADPGLTVERTKLTDEREGGGVFSSKAALTESWRVTLENHGAFTNLKDGAVEVVVLEVLPKAMDERIQVAIDSAKPKLAEGERWKKEREEKGVLAWVVKIPKGGKQVCELVTKISFPESLELVRE
jgi:uncharacterized protein (TIGR02231 family)